MSRLSAVTVLLSTLSQVLLCSSQQYGTSVLGGAFAGHGSAMGFGEVNGVTPQLPNLYQQQANYPLGLTSYPVGYGVQDQMDYCCKLANRYPDVSGMNLWRDMYGHSSYAPAMGALYGQSGYGQALGQAGYGQAGYGQAYGQELGQFAQLGVGSVAPIAGAALSPWSQVAGVGVGGVSPMPVLGQAAMYPSGLSALQTGSAAMGQMAQMNQMAGLAGGGLMGAGVGTGMIGAGMGPGLAGGVLAPGALANGYDQLGGQAAETENANTNININHDSSGAGYWPPGNVIRGIPKF